MSASRTPLAVGFLAVAAVVVAIVLISSGGGGGRTVQAEFQTARGLIDKNWVRVNGVRAGQIKDISLTSRGTALVTMKVEDWVKAPRSDASATIRPADLFGDVYLALDPGTAATPLRGPVPVAHSANVGRLDDLLRVFQAPARAGLQAVLVELGTALDKRGVDVNRALLQSRPTLRAAQQVMDELDSQRASLRNLVSSSDRMAAQLGPRRRALGHMIGSFSDLLHTTAADSGSFDASLRALPGMLSRLGRTTGKLAGVTASAQPLATSLDEAAPGLSTAMQRLVPFLDQTRTVVDEARPTVRRATRFLHAGADSFPALTSGLAKLQAGSSSLHSLTGTLKEAAPKFGPSLLAATAGQATEPGNQPFDPTTSALRRYWRGAAVLSCESFGVSIHPGCLDQAAGTPTKTAGARRLRPAAPAKAAPSPGSAHAPVHLPRLPALPLLPKGLNDTIGHLQDSLGGLTGGVQDKLKGDKGSARDQTAAGRLLDFLLGP